MTRKSIWGLVFAVIAMAGTRLAAAGPELGLAGQSNGAPVEILNGYQIVVKGSIGTLGGLHFLIDTGQTFSCIDRRIAARLQLQTQTAHVFNMDKTLRTGSAEVHDLSYAGRIVPVLRVLVADLRYSRASGVPIDGVIGLDLLTLSDFVLDLSAKRIIFGVSILRAGKNVRMVSDGTCLKVEMEVGERAVWMIADTGMKGIVFYQEELDSIAADYKVGRQINGISVGGAVPFLPALVSRLRLGGQDLNREVYLLTSGAVPQEKHVGGYVGLAALNARWIEFDFEQQTLRWSN